MPELPRPSNRPWESEPDEQLWRDDPSGFLCWARRGPLDHWCAYVGVPEGHPAHGADYSDVDVDVHGGLTFAGTWDDHPGLWWLGFDCAHLGDLVPGNPSRWRDEVYRDLEYVRRECARLAAQLAARLRIRRWRIEG